VALKGKQMRSFSAKGVVFICLAHASFFPTYRERK